MSTRKKLKLLREWKTNVRAFRQKIGVMSAILTEQAIAPLYDLETAYTKAIAALVGDTENWLDWFSNENDFGEESLSATNRDGETITVKTVADLFEFIPSEE